MNVWRLKRCVRDGRTGQLCDSKDIVGAAFGYPFPQEGPLKPVDLYSGEATVAPRLQCLGFQLVHCLEGFRNRLLGLHHLQRNVPSRH
jgi:hypothetical protein